MLVKNLITYKNNNSDEVFSIPGSIVARKNYIAY